MPGFAAAGVLGAVLCFGCAGGRGKAAGPIEKLRAELADPGKHHLRRGMEVDGDKLRSILQEFGEKNGKLLEERFFRSLEGLEEGTLPGAPGYRRVVEADLGAYPGLQEALMAEWVLEPGVEKAAAAGLSFVLPMLLVEKIDMEKSKIGSWLFFLHAAEPRYSVGARKEESVTVLADYGGRDIFAVTLSRIGYAWAAGAVVWWQRASCGKSSGTVEEAGEGGAAFSVPGLIEGDYGWYLYKEPIVVNGESAGGLAPGRGSPEAAAVHFYASWIRGDDRFLEVLPPAGKRSAALEEALGEMEGWTVIEASLAGRKEEGGGGEVWIQVELSVDTHEGLKSGTREISLEKHAGGWTVVEIPSF